jgi:hypothetical protein
VPQQFDGALAKAFPGLRERDAAFGTVQQSRVEVFFERVHLARQRRLGDVQDLRRARHAAEFGDLEKVSQLPNVHGFPKAVSRWRRSGDIALRWRDLRQGQQQSSLREL